MESMLKVLFYINIFAILMSCHSCRREKANVGITNVVEEWINKEIKFDNEYVCLLYTSPSPRDRG